MSSELKLFRSDATDALRAKLQAVSITVPLSGFSSKRETACSLAGGCRKRRLDNLSNMMNNTPDIIASIRYILERLSTECRDTKTKPDNSSFI